MFKLKAKRSLKSLCNMQFVKEALINQLILTAIAVTPGFVAFYLLNTTI